MLVACSGDAGARAAADGTPPGRQAGKGGAPADTAPICGPGHRVRLAASSGGIVLRVPTEFVDGGAEAAADAGAAVRLRVGFPDALTTQERSSRPVALTLFTDGVSKAAAEDPDGALRSALRFWREVPDAEIGAALSNTAPGHAVDVSTHFLTTGKPWPHPVPTGGECGPNAVCRPPARIAAYLIEPMPDWPFGELLVFGEGELRHELRPRPGLLPEDVWSVQTGPFDPAFTARLRGGVPLFLLAAMQPGAGRPAPDEAARRRFVASLADFVKECIRIEPD